MFHYGITREEYEKLIAKPCEICGKHKNRMALDHDHATGELRGTLCCRCNVAIAALGDCADGLRVALAYLEKYGRKAA